MKALWTQAAEIDKRRDPVTLKVYSLTNRAMYMGLACKFLQINGLGATIPTAPPVLKFKGDTISVRGEVRQGVAVWIGSGANKAGVQTELLAQRLPSPDRAPVPDAYVSRGFVALEEGDAFEATADLGPGIWALGYRFVSPLSGEERNIVPLGTFVLGLAMVQGGSPDGSGDERKAA